MPAGIGAGHTVHGQLSNNHVRITFVHLIYFQYCLRISNETLCFFFLAFFFFIVYFGFITDIGPVMTNIISLTYVSTCSLSERSLQVPLCISTSCLILDIMCQYCSDLREIKSR